MWGSTRIGWLLTVLWLLLMEVGGRQIHQPRNIDIQHRTLLGPHAQQWSTNKGSFSNATGLIVARRSAAACQLEGIQGSIFSDPQSFSQPSTSSEHKPLWPLDQNDWSLLALVVFAVFLAAGGGIGGGGVLVPALILVGGFSTGAGVALSNITIVGGALANFVCNALRRHPARPKPLIDWDLICVMEPCTILGALLGSYLNKMLPSWITTICLTVLLSFMTVKLLSKALCMFRLETERLANRASCPPPVPGTPDHPQLHEPLLNPEVTESPRMRDYSCSPTARAASSARASLVASRSFRSLFSISFKHPQSDGPENDYIIYSPLGPDASALPASSFMDSPRFSQHEAHATSSPIAHRGRSPLSHVSHALASPATSAAGTPSRLAPAPAPAPTPVPRASPHTPPPHTPPPQSTLQQTQSQSTPVGNGVARSLLPTEEPSLDAVTPAGAGHEEDVNGDHGTGDNYTGLGNGTHTDAVPNGTHTATLPNGTHTMVLPNGAHSAAISNGTHTAPSPSPPTPPVRTLPSIATDRDSSSLMELSTQLQKLEKDELRQLPLEKLALIWFLSVWTIVSDSIKVELECGSLSYWLVVLSIVPVIAATTLWMRRYLLSKTSIRERAGIMVEMGEVLWTNVTTLVYPAVCSFAGVIAGMFGVGGGIVKGPLMLEMGVDPQVAAASSATMILFTSMSASIVYWHWGRLQYDYGAALLVTGFMVTLLGQLATNHMLRVLGRRSVIVFMMGGMMASAAVVMFYQSSVMLEWVWDHPQQAMHINTICHNEV